MDKIFETFGEIPAVFDQQNFYTVCEFLGDQDAHLRLVLQNYGYPPMWTRENNFETLVHIILEQQVSLASALAALNKLRDKTQLITPENVLTLTDEEMRACYVSRQKMVYIRGLALALQSGEIDLKKFEKIPVEDIRKKLISLKGIGNWTIDVYLMFALHRIDLFPIGDLAAVNALKRLKNLPQSTPKEEIMEIADTWKPFRTVACMILWHYYLSVMRIKIAPVA